MNVVRLQGGLGNQMFQYAFGLALARTSPDELLYDTSSYDSDSHRSPALHFWRTDPPLLRAEHLPLLPRRFGGAGLWGLLSGRRPLALVRERRCRFDAKYLAPRRHTYFQGYWQSEKYFTGLRPTLLESFQPIAEVGRDATAWARRIEQTRSLAVHVRRTDYVHLPMMQVCSTDYYEQAVQRLVSRFAGIEAFVFSDDLPWCRHNLALPCPTRYVAVGAAAPHIDLWLMTLCKHHVIANSTYSWWGAWLKQTSGGETIAPCPWFADKKLQGSDVVPDAWLRFSPQGRLLGRPIRPNGTPPIRSEAA